MNSSALKMQGHWRECELLSQEVKKKSENLNLYFNVTQPLFKNALFVIFPFDVNLIAA